MGFNISDLPLIRYSRGPHCGVPVAYAGRYDAYYCPACFVWTCTKCTKPTDCNFCKNRPDTAEEYRPNP